MSRRTTFVVARRFAGAFTLGEAGASEGGKAQRRPSEDHNDPAEDHQDPAKAQQKAHQTRGLTPHALKLLEVNHARRLSLDPARLRGQIAKTVIRARRMASLRQLTIELNDQLADQLREAARQHGWTPESLAADCVARSIARGVYEATSLDVPKMRRCWKDRYGSR